MLLQLAAAGEAAVRCGAELRKAGARVHGRVAALVAAADQAEERAEALSAGLAALRGSAAASARRLELLASHGDALRARAGAVLFALRLAGGSGLYLKALTQGLQPPSVPPQPALRAQLEALGQPTCFQLLRAADPVAASRIAAADALRTQRALEVIYATGKPLSSQQSQQPPPWQVIELGLDPVDLPQRIASRTSQLYADGLVDETRGLIERYGPELPLLSTIGYGEARSLLAGRLAEAQAIRITAQRTRQFAKRQRTWFRGQHQPCWLQSSDIDAQLSEALAQVLPAVRQVLG
jgi:tRNA dimethylallyltransferase